MDCAEKGRKGEGLTEKGGAEREGKEEDTKTKKDRNLITERQDTIGSQKFRILYQIYGYFYFKYFDLWFRSEGALGMSGGGGGGGGEPETKFQDFNSE